MAYDESVRLPRRRVMFFCAPRCDPPTPPAPPAHRRFDDGFDYAYPRVAARGRPPPPPKVSPPTHLKNRRALTPKRRVLGQLDPNSMMPRLVPVPVSTAKKLEFSHGDDSVPLAFCEHAPLSEETPDDSPSSRGVARCLLLAFLAYACLATPATPAAPEPTLMLAPPPPNYVLIDDATKGGSPAPTVTIAERQPAIFFPPPVAPFLMVIPEQPAIDLRHSYAIVAVPPRERQRRRRVGLVLRTFFAALLRHWHRDQFQHACVSPYGCD